MSTNTACPACASQDMAVFFQMKGVPVHCNVLLPTRDEALAYPVGDIDLAFCQRCGLIYNLAFNSEHVTYSNSYENSLAYSSHFQEYMGNLARRLVSRHKLQSKRIIEIGCGQGDFLTMLCKMGNNQGIGFDPSYDPERSNGNGHSRATFIQDYYSERYSHLSGDLVCCRHTLEHLASPAELLKSLRRSLGERASIVFFEVPNVRYTLAQMGVWDIIYEHCAYFSRESLSWLFQACGFAILEIRETYGGQFICIEAQPVPAATGEYSCRFPDTRQLAEYVAGFAESYRNKVAYWREQLDGLASSGRRCVAWGAGSKGVSFLNTLDAANQIGYVVDINPHKQDMYVPGTGQRIVPPAFLPQYQPDVVLVMNPVYQDEIHQTVSSLGLAPQLVTV